VSSIVAIGDRTRLAGYALAGVDVTDATDPDDVREAWNGITGDVELVLLTSEARQALPDALGRQDVLVTVLPA
jgi:vacuolar-type H+-ATPase subunit F/Vma7